MYKFTVNSYEGSGWDDMVIFIDIPEICKDNPQIIFLTTGKYLICFDNLAFFHL